MGSPSLLDFDGLRVINCDTFLSRLVGFQGRCEISMDEVLWLKPCSSVHTLGMRVALSLLFLDSRHQLIRIVPTAQVNRVFVCWQASSVLEMRARHEQDIIEAWGLISSQIVDA